MGKRWGGLVLILAVMGVLAVAILPFAYRDWFSLGALKESREAWRAWSVARPGLGELAFSCGFAVMTAFYFPFAILAAVLGGYLFGPWKGGMVIWAGLLLGSLGGFLLSRLVMRGFLARHFAAKMRAIDAGVARGPFAYLLALRLATVVPPILVNALAGISPVSLRSFAAATAIGILPWVALYVSAGTILGELVSLESLITRRVLGIAALGFAFPLVCSAAARRVVSVKQREKS